MGSQTSDRWSGGGKGRLRGAPPCFQTRPLSFDPVDFGPPTREQSGRLAAPTPLGNRSLSPQLCTGVRGDARRSILRQFVAGALLASMEGEEEGGMEGEEGGRDRMGKERQRSRILGAIRCRKGPSAPCFPLPPPRACATSKDTLSTRVPTIFRAWVIQTINCETRRWGGG